MKCPKCQFENSDDAKFCNECGDKLESICTECNKTNPLGSKFCNECGNDLTKPNESASVDYSKPQSYTPNFLADKILTTRSTIEGERKLVTVFFADVANYVKMSAALDPEEVHEIMDGCFKILMDEIHEYEGTINQFTGDGIMALFGAPVSHEDHAQRACYAALSVQEAIKEYGAGIEKKTGAVFEMRIGLNSGLVIVGSIGDDLRMDYTAIGDTTNLASRIQQAAEPGKIWLSNNTRKSIGGFFKIESVGDFEFKGISEKQPAFQLLTEHKAVRTRFDAGLARGVTGLVGRKPEMQIIQTAWERTINSEARVVDIVGEAGVGKSRLAYEFQQTIAAEAIILAGACLHYGRNISYLPIIDIVRAAFGIEEGMTQEEAGKCIEIKAAEDLSNLIPFYQNLLSLKIDDESFNALNPEGRKFGTFEAVKSLLLSLSGEKPLVIFLDDVHWIDKMSEEFFVFFSHQIQGKRVLLLTAYRPEGDPAWARGAHYRHLGLETLSDKSSTHLVENILGGFELSPELGQIIADKTGGNPFFVEEIVRELIDRKELLQEGDQYTLNRSLGQLNIPGTVQGVIAARMDRLSDDLKRTMQVASVIGRDFAYKILGSIMELGDELRTHLTNLVGLEVLYEKTLYPELEYIFKNTLTQEVAYESMLKQRRREIHSQIASAIEKLYPGKLEPHYELLAHHWALSDSPERAIEYFLLAGDKSKRNQAAAAAVDFFSRALVQLEHAEESSNHEMMLRIRDGRAEPLYLMGKLEESYLDYKETIRLALESGDQHKALGCFSKIPMLIYNTTLRNEMPEICEEGIKLARRLEDKGSEAIILLYCNYYPYVWGLTNDFSAMYEALDLAQKPGGDAAIVPCLVMLGAVERWAGKSRKSIERSDGLIEMAKSQFNMTFAAGVPFPRGMALTEIGRYDEAIRLLSEWVDISEQNSLFLNLSRTANTLGYSHSEIYDLGKALNLNNRALENAINLKKNSPALLYSASEMEAQAEVNLMENEFEMGHLDDAWTHIKKYEEKATDPDYALYRDRWLNRMNLLKGNILIDKGELDVAEKVACDCLETANKHKWLKYIGRGERLLGEVSTEKEAYGIAESHLESAIVRFKEVENPKQIWKTYTAFARLYKKMNRPDLELEQWQKAAKIVMETAESLQDASLKETFMSAAPIRRIFEGTKP